MKPRLILLLALSSLLLLAPAAGAAGKAGSKTGGKSGSKAGGKTGGKDGGHKRHPDSHKPVKSTVKVKVGHLKKGRAMILSKVPVHGSLIPYRPGQKVQVNFYFNAHRYIKRRVKVHKGKGNYGTFRTVVAIKRGGKYAVSARHAANDEMRGDSTVRKSWKVRYPSFGAGHCGKVVRGFRNALNDLGYVPDKTSCINGETQRAILAFRKVNGMTRNMKASKKVVEMAFNGRGGYHVRSPGLGRHMEAPLSKQVIVFAKGKRPYAIFPVSSGKPSTPTIKGTFRFYLTQPGYNSEGMYYSFYFIRGYAVHGYESVPNYPASHGCLRTYIADQPRIYKMISYGMPIRVF